MFEDDTIEFLTFQIGDIRCGIDIQDIAGVNWVPAITPVYSAPPYVKGLLNLRGQVVTVFDLGIRLGLDACLESKKNRIIIVSSGSDYIGLLVDSVTEVVAVQVKFLGHPPENTMESQRAFFSGIFNEANKLISIIDVKKIIKPDNK